MSVFSVGISGIRTEKRPVSEANLAQPLLSELLLGAGVLLGVLGVLGVLGGRECSWARTEKLIPTVIMAKAKNLFILNIPSRNDFLGRQIITVDRYG